MQGALGAGEEAWRIREAVAECRRGMDGYWGELDENGHGYEMSLGRR